MASGVGIVVVGRNEGERLRLCLVALSDQLTQTVYVDSGSNDGSLELARSMGAKALALDPSRPFTAARARNEGFKRLLEAWPGTEFVQFVDGDSMVRPGWLERAAEFLRDNPKVAVVCGRLRERNPDASVYNRLCDIEWDQPIGVVETSGGIAMVRAEAFTGAGGFAENLIAGEEPDLCFRMRQRGWVIQRMPYEMALHDAAMFRFRQWWQRSKRSGFADAEAYKRRGDFDRRLRRRVLSNLFWGSPLGWPLWPLLWVRMFRRAGALYAAHIVLGKVPNLLGQIGYFNTQYRGLNPSLIEHK